MANPEHVAIVKQGAEVLNKWREENPNVKLDLSGADLLGAHLLGDDLLGAHLSNADLEGANLSNTILINADLRSTNLSGASLSGADLRSANLSGANLSHANLSGANLSHANLSGANLSHADLEGANLSNAILSNAFLSGANLSEAQALYTIFIGATLTGACIKDWNINHQTYLAGVICEYVFLDRGREGQYIERRPNSGNFSPGDFTKLVHKSISTVDLIFRNGISWEAFTYSFQKLQVQVGSDDLKIRKIEDKDDGTFVIAVNAPSGMDKAKTQEFLMEEYDNKLKAIESQLKLKDEQIAQYRQENTNLWEMTKKVLDSSRGNTYTTQVNAQNISGAINAADGESSALGFSQNITQLNDDNQEE